MKKKNFISKKGILICFIIGVLLAIGACRIIQSEHKEINIIGAEQKHLLANIASGTSGSCDWVIDEDGILTISPTNGTSGTLANFETNNDVPWYTYRESITKAQFQGTIYGNTYCVKMFDYCSNITEIDFTNFDVSNVTNMFGMFDSCSNLISINLGDNFDTSNVTNMVGMFYECSSLTSLNLGNNFDTSNVTSMISMFAGCSNLTSLDLGDKFDTSNVTSMISMFQDCSSLTSLDLGDNFDTSNVTNMTVMFMGCSSLTSLDLGDKFDTSNVTSMTEMFCQCSSLTSLDLGDNFDTSNVKIMPAMFFDCSNLTSLDLGDNFDTSNVKSIPAMFGGCSSLTSLDLGDKFDTSNVTEMSAMFERCSSLTSLDLGDNFDTSNVKTMPGMFYECSSLTSLDLSSFDTSSVTNMSNMLFNTASLRSLTLSSDFEFKSTDVLDDYTNPSKWHRVGTNENYTSAELMSNYNGSTMAGEYRRIEYTIEFNGNGATSGSTASMSMYGGEAKNLTSNGFTRTGYGFKGWNSKADGTGVSYVNEQSVIDLTEEDGETVTLFAQWQKAELMQRETAQSNQYYVIGADQNASNPRTNTGYLAEQISTITLVDNKTTMPNTGVVDSWDVSKDNDGSVIAWITDAGIVNEVQMYNLYIGGNGAGSIVAPNSGYNNGLFQNYNKCTIINGLEFLDTSSVTNMNNMFYNCSNLTSLDLGDRFDTSGVTNMQNMFLNCSSLASLDLGDKFDTSNVIDMNAMFYGCSSLASLDLGDNFNTSNVTNISAMFYGCSSLTSLELDDNFDTSNVTNISAMFYGSSSLTSLDLGDNFDTSNVTNISAMFYGCGSLTNLDLGDKFDTSNVKNMNAMFLNCSSLVSLDLGDKFDTSNVIDMSAMFYGCSGLASLDLGDNFNTSNVTNISAMFYGCSSLASLDIGDNFNTSNVTYMGSMFYECSSLTSLDLSSFNTSSVTNMSNMLTGMTSLRSLTLSSDFEFKSTDVLSNYTNPSKWHRVGTNENYTSAELMSNYNGLTMAGEYRRVGYTVEFYQGNNSTLAGATKLGEQIYYSGETQNLNAYNGTVPSGWIFAGWGTTLTATNVTYTNQQSVTNLTDIDGDVIELYAIFKRQINFYEGIGSNSTRTQYYNPYQTTGSITSVTVPVLNDLNRWTKLGYRTDTEVSTATVVVTTEEVSITPPYDQTELDYYGVYARDILLYSGIAEASSVTRTQYLNVANNGTVSSINAPTPITISGWTVRGYSEDTSATSISYEITTDTDITPAYTSDNNLYAVYNRTISVVYLGNGATSGSVPTSETTQYYNTHGDITSNVLNLAPNGYTKTGYTAKTPVWNTKADGTGEPHAAEENYTFAPIVDENATITMYAQWSAEEDIPYVVKHWQQKLTGEAGQYDSTNYDIKDTQNLTGEADSQVTPAFNTYEGFTPAGTEQTITIATDGSTVVNYYYNRNSYDVTLNKGTGIEEVTGAGSYLYGEEVTINATMKEGYRWVNWTGTNNITTKNYTFTMPAENINDTANGEIDENQTKMLKYTVEYYKDGILQDTQTESKEVQVLEDDTIDVDHTKINITDKYEGYTFERTEPEIILDVVDNGTIIKVYYISIRKIIVKYVDKNDPENVLLVEERKGKHGTTVETEAKDFDGYVLVEKPDIEEHTFNEEEQVVYYYYAKQSSGVIAKYINILNNNLVADSEAYEGLEGTEYETESKEIEGFNIVTNKEYYDMIVRRDENFLSDNEVETVEEYLEKKGIDGEEEYIPKNAKGEMAEELIEVKYYYMPKVKLIVKYKDIYSEEDLKENIDGELVDSTLEYEGIVNEEYETEAKDFEKYYKVTNKIFYKAYLRNHPEVLEESEAETLEKYLEINNIDPEAEYVPENAKEKYEIVMNEDGTYTNEIIITYYYVAEREVKVKYYDKTTGEEIAEEEIKIGPDGELYDLADEKRQIEGYTLVEEPEESKGVYKEDNETKNYYYAKNTQIIVKYVDKGTEEEIIEDVIIDGYEGKEYITEKKAFEGYEFEEVDGDADGTMTDEPITIKYYYIKKKAEEQKDEPKDESKEENKDSKKEENSNSGKTTIINNYYYTDSKKDNTQNNQSTSNVAKNTVNNTNIKNTAKEQSKETSTPKTGDILPIIAFGAIGIVVLANIIQMALTKKKKDKKSKIE